METISFAFGALSIIGLLLVILIVVGVVKVIKQEKQIVKLNKCVSDFEQSIWRALTNQGSETHRRIDQVDNNAHTYCNNITTDSVTQCNSYTDKRIDKLIDTYFTVKESKQILTENKQK
jgi:hypothetical protein